MDNLERAINFSKEEYENKDNNLYEGVKMTNQNLIKSLEKNGLKRINPLGEKFDPNFHEAMFEVEDSEKEAGTVAHVAQ